jgi:hypothetical protein
MDLGGIPNVKKPERSEVAAWKQRLCCVICEVITAVTRYDTSFWDVMPCGLVDVHWSNLLPVPAEGRGVDLKMSVSGSYETSVNFYQIKLR